VFRFSGPPATVAEQGAAVLAEWVSLDPDASTANLIACPEDEQTILYCVLRNRFLEYAPGFPYRVGSMEAAGVFVYSKDEEIDDLLKGKIGYRQLWQVLKSVHPPGAARMTIGGVDRC
jgi:hypothetical protein